MERKKELRVVAPGKPLAHRILLSSPQLLALGASRRVGTTDPPALHGLSGPLEILQVTFSQVRFQRSHPVIF